MPDDFDQEDPFKKYGGQQITKQEDPFKKYGGAVINMAVKKKVSSPVLTNGGIVGSSNGLPEGSLPTADDIRRKAQWDKVMNPKGVDFDPNDPVKSVSNSIFSKTIKFNPPKSESTNQHYLSGQHQVEKQIEEDKNNEKITPHIAAQAMKNVNETTFPTAASARHWQYQQGKQFDPNNQTDQLAKSVINENEKVRSTIANNNGDLTKSAFDYYADADPQLKVLKDAGKEPPPEVGAKLLYNFLQDKNVQELANENQDFKNKYQAEKTGFFENHPDLRATKILNQIAQGREDYGYNNPFLNLVGTESSDKVIENLSMRGQIDKWDKDFYYKYVRPMIGTHMRQIPTSGLIETAFQGAAKGLEDIPKGVYEATGLRNAVTSKSDRAYQNLEEDAKQLNVNPRGVNYISHTIGNLAGVLAPISGGAKALKAINLVKDADAANNIAMGLTFYHDIQKQAEENNPNDPLGNHLSALIQSAIFMKINPAFKGLSKAIMRDAQPEIESTLNKLKTEAISPDAAKESIVHEVLGKAVDVGKKSLDMATQMSVATGLNHVVDGIFSGKFDADKTVQDMAKTFESMLIGGIGLNVATMGGRTKAEGISSEPLNEKETAAIDAIKGKEFTALKPYTDILHDENSSVQDKRAALKGISDQLLAHSGAERAGAELGQKASVAIEDLGYEAPKESEALANIQEPQPLDQAREVDNGMTPPEETPPTPKGNTDNVGGEANQRLKDLGVKEGDVVEDKDGNKFQVKELFTDPYLPGQQRYKLQTEDGKIKIEGQTSGYKKSDGFNVTDTGAAEVKKVVDDFDRADQTSIQDLVDSIDGIEELPEKIRDAVDKYRQEQDYDTKLSGRGDMEAADAAFEKTVRDFVKQSLSQPSNPTVQSQKTKADNVGGEHKIGDEVTVTAKDGTILGEKAKVTAISPDGKFIQTDLGNAYVPSEQVSKPSTPTVQEGKGEQKTENNGTQKANEEGGGSDQPGKQQATQTGEPIEPVKTEGEGTPPPGKPGEPVGEGKGRDKLNDKGILNKLYNAKGTPQAAKEGFKAEGLEYQTKSQEEAEGVAKSVVDELGVDDAVLAAQAQKFDGDVNSLIFGEALNRLKEQEDAATTPEAKLEAAMKFAEVGIAYDKAARSGGRFNAAINRFYKKSPLGIVIMENQKRADDFNQWSKPKDKSWKEFHDEMMKNPEYEAIVKEQVKEGMKQERADARKARIKKVDDFFEKAKDQFKDGALYSTIIPPKVIRVAIDGMQKAYHAGEKVTELIEKAVDYISDQMGSATWDKDKFRKEWEEKLKDPIEKKPLTDEEIKSKVLDKFRNKLKGLSDKQKEEVVVKAHRKIIESGGLDYQDFKDIIAGVLGRGELTKAEAEKIQEMVKKINDVDAAGERARTQRTEQALRDFRKAQLEAGIASKDLSAMLYTKPNITKRLTSMMQLNTLGIPALINNPVYNVVNTLGIRFPVGVVKSGIDRAIQGIGKVFGKDIQPETNVFSLQVQKEFFKKLGLGSKEAVTQFVTGLNRMDYTQKELYGQQLRPAKSVRDLWEWKQGKLKLTSAQVMDKMLQASPQGWTAEIIARTLNLGDKPQRFAAEGAQASAFAKGLGLKNIDYNLFVEFPREEAYIQLKKKGLSDAEAAKRADYIRDTIVKEGERSTFQQDNFLNDILTKAFGGDKSGIGSLAKATIISPYIKIPSNAFWSYYNIVNPEVALLQSMIYTAKGIAKKTGSAERFLGDTRTTSAGKDFNEAKYWFAHAAVGVATRAVIISLVGAGIFRPGNNQDDTKKEREGEQNYEPQGTVNVTKLWAWMNGKDPSKVKGGLTVGTKWIGHWGSVGNTIAKKWEDMTPEQKKNQEDFWNTAFGGMELPALQEFEQGVFGNTSTLLQALNSSGGQGLNYWGVNTINMFANIVHPAALAQISRAELPYYTTAKADSFGQQLKNSMLTRSSVIRSLVNQYPPSKISIWGEPLQKKGSVIEKLFGFNNTTKDNFAQPIYEDYLKTNDIGFFPPAVPPILNGKKLNTEQERKLDMYVGQARKSYIAPFINDQANIDGYNVKYSQLDKKDKKEVLQYLYELGKDNGVERFTKEHPDFEKKEENTDYKKEAQKEIFHLLQKYKN